MTKGWRNEGYRHGLSAKGVKTKANGCKKSMGIKDVNKYQRIMAKNKGLEIMFTNYLYHRNCGHRGGAYMINEDEVHIFNPQFDDGPDPPVAVMINNNLVGFTYSTLGVAKLLTKNGIKINVKDDEEADLLFSKSKGVSDYEDGLEDHSWFGSGGDHYETPKEFLDNLIEIKDSYLIPYTKFIKRGKLY